MKTKLITGRILTPLQFSGSVHGDYGYEIDGVKSNKSYATAYSARRALARKLEKLNKDYRNNVTNN